MSMIHPTAIIGKNVDIADDATIGPYCIIEDDVTIGSGTVLKNNVVIGKWTEIGSNNQIWSGAVIGVAPQDLSYKGQKTFTVIGNDNTIREHVTIHRATDEGDATTIGDGNLLMAQVHVAHNCQLGSEIIIANSVGLAGHIVVEDQAVIGGMTGLHQFVRVGRLAMLGGMSKVRQDVPPFSMVDGLPIRLIGLNSRGLQRRGITKESRSALKRSYSILFREGNNLTQGLEIVDKEIQNVPEVDHLKNFLRAKSRLGVCIRERESTRKSRVH